MNLITRDELNQSLARTIELHEAVQKLLDAFIPYPELRFGLAFQSGLLSIEHASAAMLLMQNNMPPPAMALLRPQYESLVRGIWLMFAATENQVEKLALHLTKETAKRGDDLPMLSDMLKQLEKAEQTPKHLVVQLKSYKDIS